MRGLKTLHDMKILHRDLKCANVFISKDGRTAKLGDLNVSKVAKAGLVRTQTGTPYYASPEVWKDKPYGSKSDIWSLGCVIYEMAALKPPFRAQNMEGLYHTVLNGKFDRIPRNFSSHLSKLLTRMLQVNPKDRPSCDEILNMPLIKKIANKLDFSKEVSTSIPTKAELMKTIKLPRNLKCLRKWLPKPNYDVRSSAEK